MRLALLPTTLIALLAGCAGDGADEASAGTVSATIAEIQGADARSPLEGRTVAVEGVVNGVFGGGLGGVFIASTTPDAEPSTSEGLFVVHPLGTLPKLSLGDRVKLVGTIRELGDGDSTLTAIEPTQVVADGQTVVPTADLVEPPTHGWESLEGMRLRIAGPLTVTGVDGLDRFGELVLAFGDRLYAPTELAIPGDQAQAIAADAIRRLRIDDAIGKPDPDSIWYLAEKPTDVAPLRVGSKVVAVEGVLDERFGGHRLQLVEKLGGIGHAPRPEAPTVKGDRRIAAFNLHNLFNGDGTGGGFPTERGAASREEYERQQRKLVAIVQALDPDLAALMELENDGYGPESSLAQFVAALNAAGPHADWHFVDAGEGPGTNAIRVGLIYRASRVTPVGAPVTIADGPFAERSRAPLVQAFQAGSGPVFVVAANHFESKGCGRDAQGADLDNGDGQGCFNATRVASARQLHEWLATDPTGSDGIGTLVLGDLNAYAQEDPLRLLGARGWQDAFALAKAEQPYSFVYDGQSGRLDHALLDARLAPRLRGAAEWHVNADEAEGFDYHRDQDGDPWRASDHDPMLLGLDLTSPGAMIGRMDALPAFPTESGPLHIAGPAGRLELMVDLPEPGQERAGVAVICHPNPPDGGTLHNKVVTMTARALSELGITALRLNFRGVGQSEGTFDEGRGETLDLLAVTDWVRKVRPNDALWLAGFSFGSWVALQAARHLPVKQMISIAPPVGLRPFEGVLPPPCPWLVVMGEADDLVDPQKVYAWLDSLKDKPTLVKMPDTGHFFHRRLIDLRGAIKNGVRKNLPPPKNG